MTKYWLRLKDEREMLDLGLLPKGFKDIQIGRSLSCVEIRYRKEEKLWYVWLWEEAVRKIRTFEPHFRSERVEVSDEFGVLSSVCKEDGTIEYKVWKRDYELYPYSYLKLNEIYSCITFRTRKQE